METPRLLFAKIKVKATPGQWLALANSFAHERWLSDARPVKPGGDAYYRCIVIDDEVWLNKPPDGVPVAWVYVRPIPAGSWLTVYSEAKDWKSVRDTWELLVNEMKRSDFESYDERDRAAPPATAPAGGNGEVVRVREYTFSMNANEVMQILWRWIKPEDDDLLTRSFGPRTDNLALPPWLTNFRRLPVNTSTGHGLEFIVDIRINDDDDWPWLDGEQRIWGDVSLGRVEFEVKRAGECKGYLYVVEEKEFVPGARIEFPTPVELAQEILNARAAGTPIKSVMARYWEGPPIETPTPVEMAQYWGRFILTTVWDAIVSTLQTQPAAGDAAEGNGEQAASDEAKGTKKWERLRDDLLAKFADDADKQTMVRMYFNDETTPDIARAVSLNKGRVDNMFTEWRRDYPFPKRTDLKRMKREKT